jgi:hypothetical protein
MILDDAFKFLKMKKEKFFLSSAHRFPKDHLFLKGSQASPIYLAEKRNV